MGNALAIDAPPSARLKRACEHVARHWLPVNTNVYDSIQTGLLEGRYQLSLQFLLQDLSQDISLLLYCLREIALKLRAQGVLVHFESPLQLLEAAGLERLKEILSMPKEAISPHTLEDSVSPQMKRLEAALISSTTAAILAERDEYDVEAAKMTAILRQLGLLLIAWNYPSVYARALQKRSKSIEKALDSILGFSPLLLARSIVSSWGIAAHIRHAAYGDSAITSQERRHVEENEEHSSYLRKLCEIGESLARANDPDTYPTAAHDWAAARKVLQEALGDNALNTLNEKLKENCSAYRMLLPRTLGMDTPFDPDSHLHQHSYASSAEIQTIAAGLDNEFSAALKRLYRDLSAGLSPHECLDMLVKHIIPISHLSGLIVFTYDPTSKTLVPRLKTGSIRLRSLRPVNLLGISERPDPVAVAWQCLAPLSGAGDSGECVYIAATLGNNNKSGVVYVESGSHECVDPQTAMREFKAIRKAFTDCLRLD